jgi:putative aminopeptidase FrvX
MTARLPELLTKFSQAHGTSGYEDEVRQLFVRELGNLVDEIEITRLGSVVGIKRAHRGRSRGASSGIRTPAAGETPRVLIEAHLDEIGLIVTGIDDGYLKFEEVGNWDPRVLPSQDVIVHGRKTLRGVIGSRPPHVLSADERKKAIAFGDLFIDVGMDSAQVRELVSIGDVITLDRRVTPLQNSFYAGKAFDDRASIVALLEMLRQLQTVEHAWDIYVVANVNEEDSALYVGALTSAFQIHPQVAISLDVTHAQQHGLGGDELPGLNQGPCIARGANIHPVVLERLRDAAQRAAIPHQITVYGGNTETNAWMMQVAGEGTATGLVEIPLKYMHTAVEMLHLDDVARAAQLLCTFVSALSLEDQTTLQGERFVRADESFAQSPRSPGTNQSAKTKRSARPRRAEGRHARTNRHTVKRKRPVMTKKQTTFRRQRVAQKRK